MATTVKTDLPEICKRYPPLAGFWAEALFKHHHFKATQDFLLGDQGPRWWNPLGSLRLWEVIHVNLMFVQLFTYVCIHTMYMSCTY